MRIRPCARLVKSSLECKANGDRLFSPFPPPGGSWVRVHISMVHGKKVGPMKVVHSCRRIGG
eukprot:7838738-Prorocentrum_lima.AAC.1